MRPLQKLLLTVCAIWLAMRAGIGLFHELSDGTPFGGDFVCFWNAPHRVRHGDIAAIYDPDTWRRILASTGAVSLSWFVYPPFTLFGLWALGDATYNEAVLAWSLVPLAFYFVLIVLLAKRSGLGGDANPVCENSCSREQAYGVLIAFSSPFLCANLFSGQTGTLVAVFFLGTAYFWPTRPVLAGICIGLLAIKPQMGLLILPVLLASGQWRVMAVAAATVLSLIVLSTIWLGAAIWTDYFRMSLLFGDFIGSGYSQKQLALSPYVSLRAAGMPAALAGFFQVSISVAVLTAVVRVFWRWKLNLQKSGKEDEKLDLRFGLLAAGALLATPYSLSYDTPLLMLAIIPLLARGWRDGWNGIEVAAAAALLISPYAQFFAVGWHVPFAFLALLLWFGITLWRFQKDRTAEPDVFVLVRLRWLAETRKHYGLLPLAALRDAQTSSRT